MKKRKYLVDGKAAGYILYAIASAGAVAGFVGGLSSGLSSQWNIAKALGFAVFGALLGALVVAALVTVVVYIPAMFIEAHFRDKSDRIILRVAKLDAYGILNDFLIRKSVFKDRVRLKEIIEILYGHRDDESNFLLTYLHLLEEEQNKISEQQNSR